MQLDTVTLPSDLLWLNEFEWNQAVQSHARTLSGAIEIQTAANLKLWSALKAFPTS